MKKFFKLHKEKLEITFLAMLMAVFMGVLNHNGCFDRDPLREVDCAQFVEGLPDDVYEDVNAACNEAIERGWVDSFQVRAWFNQNRVVYTEVPFMYNPTLFGYVMPRANYYEFFVLPNPVESENASEHALTLFPIMRRRVAFHETIHIMLEIKGMSFDNDGHHQFMDEHGVCPGSCPEGMVSY